MEKCCGNCIHKKVCDYWDQIVYPNDSNYDGYPCADYFPADAEPIKHGKWIAQEQEYPMMGCKIIVGYNCSICGGKQELKTNYCCDCGARMDGGNSNDR